MGSNSNDNGGFSVVVERKEVVAAVLPMQEHWLPMSNLDLLLPALDVSVFFCYKKSEQPPTSNSINPDTNTKELPPLNTCDKETTATATAASTAAARAFSALKIALAQALVSFYPFAGEVVDNRLGEPELLCNNRGVDFIQAYADVELKELDLHHPDDSVHGKLVPFKNQGVLCIQVTELKCGGLVVGLTFDHRVADAHSANMFFVAWANIARAPNPPSPPPPHHHQVHHIPCFRRSLLSPRRPGHYHPSIHNMYVFVSSLPPPPSSSNADQDHLLTRIYYVKAEEINRLQSQASTPNSVSNSNGGDNYWRRRRRSKLESLTAFLWKLIANGGSDDHNTKSCKMGVVVDGRERLINKNGRSRGGGGEDTTEAVAADFLMQNYFGNVLSVPYVEETVGKLKAMELSEVAEAVHESVVGAATEEHFLGLIDWVEEHRPEKAIVRVYCKEENEEAAVVVSSGQRFPVGEVDFGWGKPAFGSYHFPWGGQTGYVMPMPSSSREGDWIVYMHLLEKHLDLVESEAQHIFRPLTPSYLNLK